ncbi:MAG: Hsp70 family protein, partial [Brooklawnia sp.]
SAAAAGRNRPERLACRITGRIGDQTPLRIAGHDFDAAELVAAQVAWVVDRAAERHDRQPDGITIAYPTSWGPHRLAALTAALDEQGLANITFLTMAEAAAQHYLASTDLVSGQLLAVYDLGNDFECTVLRVGADGVPRLLASGQATSVIGGDNFDDAVFAHVRQAAGIPADISPTDTIALAGLAELRHNCVTAKESLSFETDVTVPVEVPPVDTSVRLTRSEFEQMIADSLDQTVDLLEETVERAGGQASDLAAVVLIGGSARIPLVTQRLSEQLDCPIVIERDPKATATLGAAQAGLAVTVEQLPAESSAELALVAAGELATKTQESRRRARSRASRLVAVLAALVLSFVVIFDVSRSPHSLTGLGEASQAGPKTAEPMAGSKLSPKPDSADDASSSASQAQAPREAAAVARQPVAAAAASRTDTTRNAPTRTAPRASSSARQPAARTTTAAAPPRSSTNPAPTTRPPATSTQPLPISDPPTSEDPAPVPSDTDPVPSEPPPADEPIPSDPAPDPEPEPTYIPEPDPQPEPTNDPPPADPPPADPTSAEPEPAG